MEKNKLTILIRSEDLEKDEHIEAKVRFDWYSTSYNLSMAFYYTLQKMGFNKREICEGMNRVVENKGNE